MSLSLLCFVDTNIIGNDPRFFRKLAENQLVLVFRSGACEIILLYHWCGTCFCHKFGVASHVPAPRRAGTIGKVRNNIYCQVTASNSVRAILWIRTSQKEDITKILNKPCAKDFAIREKCDDEKVLRKCNFPVKSTCPSAFDFVCLLVCCYKPRKSLLRLPPWTRSKTPGSISTRAA